MIKKSLHDVTAKDIVIALQIKYSGGLTTIANPGEDDDNLKNKNQHSSLLNALIFSKLISL